MAVLFDQFVETLSQSGLMTAREIGAFLDHLTPDEKPESAEDLAKLLYRRKKLTRFQAQCIYQGKTRGLVVGNYVVLDKIGQGGMGHVYKARHRRMERVVALKVLPSSVTRSPEAVRRFQREMVAAAKPSNLLLDPAGTVKILDMGLARLDEELGEGESTAAAALTQSGQVMGTIDYMPPEQALDTRNVDHRADIYSLGCTLYYLLNGRAVYGGETLAKKILAHQRDPVPSLSDRRRDVPEELNAVFRKMLAKRVDQRYDSMSDVLADLEKCRAGLGQNTDETIAFRGPAAAEVDTSSDQHDAQVPTVDVSPDNAAPNGAAPDMDSALDRWLNEELPEGPTHFITKPRKRAKLSQERMVLGSVVAGVAFLLLLAFGIVITVRTPEGTLVVTVDEPDAQISVDDGKITLKSPGDAEPVQIEIVEGEHTLKVTKGGFQGFSKEFSMNSGGRETLNVKLVPLVAAKTKSGTAKADLPTQAAETAKPKAESGERKAEGGLPLAADPDRRTAEWVPEAGSPPLAVAPFDAAQAKRHQQAWADYLGVPVESENTIGLKMVLIPPGEFLMGSTEEEQARFLEEARAANDTWAIERIPSEGPQHRVRITRPFRLSRCEVTVGQFRQFVKATGYKTEAERDGKGGCGPVDGQWVPDPRFVWTDPGFEQTDEHPVVNVSWNDAAAFCQWLSEKAGAEYVLPTEAQWEYACRAGTTPAWQCGDSDTTFEEFGWFVVNSGGTTHPAGQLKPNGWSLCDMHGNVWEWCADCWAIDYYAQSPPNDPNGPPTGSHRVSRGGIWNGDARHCRSAYRDHYSPGERSGGLGFRLACVLADE
jgi:formylglycine-generating enzyme required for sulfatase activity